MCVTPPFVHVHSYSLGYMFYVCVWVLGSVLFSSLPVFSFYEKGFGCLGTHHVDQAVLELRVLFPVSQVLERKGRLQSTWPTMFSALSELLLVPSRAGSI